MRAYTIEAKHGGKVESWVEFASDEADALYDGFSYWWSNHPGSNEVTLRVRRPGEPPLGTPSYTVEELRAMMRKPLGGGAPKRVWPWTLWLARKRHEL